MLAEATAQKQSLSWDAKSRSVSKEIPSLPVFTKPEVQRRVHKSTSRVPALNHANPSVPSQHIHLLRIYVLSSHLCIRLPSGFFPLVFPTKILYEFLIYSMRAIISINPILLDLITLIIRREEKSTIFLTVQFPP